MIVTYLSQPRTVGNGCRAVHTYWASVPFLDRCALLFSRHCYCTVTFKSPRTCYVACLPELILIDTSTDGAFGWTFHTWDTFSELKVVCCLKQMNEMSSG